MPFTDPLAMRARATPTATALVEAETGAAWSYRDLNAAVDDLAAALATLGVEAGDNVGAVVETHPDGVRLVHALWRLGATLVPLNARLTAGELAPQLGRADVSLVVHDDATAAVTQAAATEADPTVPAASVEGGLSTPDGSQATDAPQMSDGSQTADGSQVADGSQTADAPRREIAPGHTAVILFTSGTTGAPKAVTLTFENLVASAAASAFRLGVCPSDRWFDPLALYHMGGLAPVVRATVYGTTVVTQREFDAEATVDALREHDATGVSLVPTMLSRLLDAGDPPDSLRFVLLGGAPASEELVRRCASRDVPVCPTYGMTETASQVATARPDEAAAHPGTVGTPLVGTAVTVVDDGTVCDPGERGELVVRGPTVTPGYYDDPAATAAAFGDHGLHTGDVGYRDEDGRLWVLGRADDVIVTGGENVRPDDVADAIRALDGVEDVAVVGLPDEEWGEVVGALVCGDVAPERVRAHCRARLADFKRPKVVATADSLPRTPSGTVDRDAVRARLESAR